MKRLNKKGFTMAELLIVVAIIAVLVAIAIPVFTAQLEKAREATDLANIRAAYAEVTAEAISDGSADISASVTLKQTKTGWEASNASNTVAGVAVSSIPSSGNVDIKFTKSTGKITIGGQEVPSSALSSGSSGSSGSGD